MANESAITLTKAAEAQLVGKSILPMIGDPDGVPDDFRINFASIFGGFYKITPSVSSNNLTLAIQHLDGSNPSVANPLGFKIGDSWKLATGALSVTKNAGTNWMNAGSTELAAQAIDFFVYVIKETGAVAGIKIGFSRIPYARTMADFVNTTTNQKYIPGSWTNFNGTDEVAVVGRFRAQLSASASYNWSIATSIVINRPIYETDWLGWIPTQTGWGGSPPSGGIYQYRVDKNNVEMQLSQPNNATSTTTTVIFTLPFTALTLTNKLWTAQPGQCVDNGAVPATPCYGELLSASANLNFYKDFAGTGWTASGNKRIVSSELAYQI